ncbi:shikimate dehydrogenase family protein [Micrococcoides hystricis]|uniref:Shikimate dehydrogenase family protein n=1 Tax=Micrococcoides hystricis TaxID=1572761 RepID=A0ABV6P7H4_9MICC
MATNLSPHRAGVIGDPIEHSKSPDLHRAAYQVLGLDCTYARYQVATGEGVAFYRSFTADPSAIGLSVTMPQKAEFLAELDHRSSRVERLGALNTVYRRTAPDGATVWCAENTDVDGIRKALAHAAGTLAAGPWLILGAGNTAAAAIAAAAEAGATAVNFVARNRQRATGSTELASRYGLASTVYAPDEFTPELARGHAAVVSTLPAGAADTWLQNWPRGELLLPPLLDVAYEPWPSVLATGWQDRGGAVLSGLEMLLYQAVEQIKLFAPSHWAQGKSQDVLDAMCDAVKLPRRKV